MKIKLSQLDIEKICRAATALGEASTLTQLNENLYAYARYGNDLTDATLAVLDKINFKPSNYSTAIEWVNKSGVASIHWHKITCCISGLNSFRHSVYGHGASEFERFGTSKYVHSDYRNEFIEKYTEATFFDGGNWFSDWVHAATDTVQTVYGNNRMTTEHFKEINSINPMSTCQLSGFYCFTHDLVEVYDSRPDTGEEHVCLAYIGVVQDQTKKCYFSSSYATKRCSVTIVINGSTRSARKSLLEKNEFRICSKCGKAYPISEFCDDDNPTVCSVCSGINWEAHIRQYNDTSYQNPIPDVIERIRKVNRKGVDSYEPVKIRCMRLIGVEVEVGYNTPKIPRGKVAKELLEKIGTDFAHAKHDGSITRKTLADGAENPGALDYGFELVTAPAGINVHRDRWPKILNSQYFKYLRSWDTKVCGFHVHINRYSLTIQQIARINFFMNHENNINFLQVVAGRSKGRWSKFIPKTIMGSIETEKDKYVAFRTNKEHTVEFRIFRGTHNPDHIIRNIEFCLALCDFCAPCNSSMLELSNYTKFIEFAYKNGHDYPKFVRWLKTVGGTEIAKGRRATRGSIPNSIIEEVISEDTKTISSTIVFPEKSKTGIKTKVVIKK